MNGSLNAGPTPPCQPGHLKRLTIASLVFAAAAGGIVWLVTAFVSVLASTYLNICAQYCERGSVVVDPRTNTLFVQDTGAKLEEVRTLIKKIDIAVRQVLIEARIVEATDNFSRSLGVRLGILDRSGGSTFQNVLGADRMVIGGQQGSVGSVTGQTTPTPGSFLPESLIA